MLIFFDKLICIICGPLYLLLIGVFVIMSSLPFVWVWGLVGCTIICQIGQKSLLKSISSITLLLLVFFSAYTIETQIWFFYFLTLMLLLLILGQSYTSRHFKSIFILGLVFGIGFLTILMWAFWRSEQIESYEHALQYGHGFVWSGIIYMLRFFWLRHVSLYSPNRWLRHSEIFFLLIFVVMAHFLRAEESKPVFPNWLVTTSRLSSPNLDNIYAWQSETWSLSEINRLRTAGFRDAAYVYVTWRFLENASPSALRRDCPEQNRSGVLGEEWSTWIHWGKRLCQWIHSDPSKIAEQFRVQEETAAFPDSVWPFSKKRWQGIWQRLVADLYMDSGRIEPALDWYSQAIQSQDLFSQRNAVRALIDRNRHKQALKWLNTISKTEIFQDPWLQLWLFPDQDRPELWQTWNEMMNFDSLQSLDRLGIYPRFGLGEVMMYFSEELGHLVALVKSPYPFGFDLKLPLTPGRRWPNNFEIRIKNNYRMHVQFEDTKGNRVFYSCLSLSSGADKSKKVIRLDAKHCNGKWTTIFLRPQEYLSGELRQWSIGGRIFVAKIQGQP